LALDGDRNEASQSHTGYVWSDDESKTEEMRIDPNDDVFAKTTTGESVKHPSSGLSASSFDVVVGSETGSSIRHRPGRSGADSIPSSSDENDETPIAEKTSEDSDENLLQKDVESNLHVLAQIFPAVDTQPLKLRRRSQVVDSEGISKAAPTRTGDAAPGWGTSGQILRYDPTRQDASTFVVQAESCPTIETMVSQNVTSGTNGDLSSKPEVTVHTEKDSGEFEENEIQFQPPEVAEGVAHGTQDRRTHLYNQDKLEAVFREAREEPPTFTQDPAEQSKSGSSFAFSFTLDGEAGAPTGAIMAQGVPFAFSFGLDDIAKRDDLVEISGQEIIAEERGQESEELTKRRRLDAPFSNEELDSYIHQFLTTNGGGRILVNVEEWRNDEALKAQWLKERAVLTLDWKRKHKTANARRTANTRKA
jgi:hypothetical protein